MSEYVCLYHYEYLRNNAACVRTTYIPGIAYYTAAQKSRYLYPEKQHPAVAVCTKKVHFVATWYFRVSYHATIFIVGDPHRNAKSIPEYDNDAQDVTWLYPHEVRSGVQVTAVHNKSSHDSRVLFLRNTWYMRRIIPRMIHA